MTPRDEPNPYEVLQVEADATTAAIRAAYRRLAAASHPDTHPGAEATARMARLNAAWQTLSDAARRAAWHADHAPACSSCGLGVGGHGAGCRVCCVQDGPSMRSTDANPRRFNASLWSVRVQAPLAACEAEVAAAFATHAPSFTRGVPELSDSKFEATVPLGDAGEMALVGARLWRNDRASTTLRVSVAADLPWSTIRGEAERAAFDRLVLSLARELEGGMRARGLRFEAVA